MKNLNLLFILLSVSTINIVASSQETDTHQTQKQLENSQNSQGDLLDLLITTLESSNESSKDYAAGQNNNYLSFADAQLDGQYSSCNNNSSSQSTVKYPEYNLSQITKKHRTDLSQAATHQEEILLTPYSGVSATQISTINSQDTTDYSYFGNIDSDGENS